MGVLTVQLRHARRRISHPHYSTLGSCVSGGVGFKSWELC